MKSEDWIQWVLRPLVVAAMIGSLIVSVVSLVRMIFPVWDGTYLVVLCALAALEGYYAYRVLHLDVTRMSDPAKWRTVELVMFFLAVRAAGLISDGRALMPGQISVLDAKTAASYILLVLCWLGATNTSRDLLYVGDAPDRDFRYVPPIDRLVSRFFFGGGVLLLASGLGRIGYRNVFSLSRASVSGVVLNVLVYFVLGVIMLGQIRYSTLRSRWTANGMRIAEGLSRRWLRYSVTFLCVVALAVILLPTSYTVSLLDLLQSILASISAICLLFWYVVAFPFGWILAHLLHVTAATHPARLPRIAPSRPPISHPYSWTGLLRSIVFWGIVLACFIYMLRNYLQRHKLVGRLGSILAPLTRLLLRIWIAVWRRARGYARSAAERMPRLRPRRPPAPSPRVPAVPLPSRRRPPGPGPAPAQPSSPHAAASPHGAHGPPSSAREAGGRCRLRAGAT